MATLAEILEPSSIDFDRLHVTYGPMLHIVEELIGVVPDCDPYLEIWSPGFRTYNLLVPNFLNLPASIVGRTELKALMGLAMYTSSRAAGCAYCSAHCCSFAMRRGASDGAIDGSARTDVEAAVVALAESVSTVPATFDRAHFDELGKYLPAGDIEWIAMSIAMMGFLNKVMDALGIPLEAEAINDVAELIEPTGWAVGQHAWRNGDTGAAIKAVVPVDSVRTSARVVRRIPGAVRLEREWIGHIPKSAPDVRRFIRETYGLDVAVLSRLHHGRPMRALAGMLEQNLDPTVSVLGIGNKALVGLVFAKAVGNAELIDQAHALGAANDVAASTIEAAREFAESGDDSGLSTLDDRTAGIVRLAAASSPSPAEVTAEVAADAASVLSEAEIVELTVWISVQQLLHRLSLMFG